MLGQLFNKVSDQEKTEAIKKLMEHSVPSNGFFFMVFLSIVMATFGLLINSSPVIIGSMLIAPILYPVLGLSMGIIMSDDLLIRKSFFTFGKAVIIGILVSAGVTLLFSSQTTVLSNTLISLTKPNLISFMIGATAGLAASFAIVKRKFNEMLPGVAISVALIPPLAVIGIGLAKLNMTMFMNSLLLFIINTAGIIFTAIIVFSLMNFYTKRKEAEKIIAKDEKEIAKEETIQPEKKEF